MNNPALTTAAPPTLEAIWGKLQEVESLVANVRNEVAHLSREGGSPPVAENVSAPELSPGETESPTVDETRSASAVLESEREKMQSELDEKRAELNAVKSEAEDARALLTELETETTAAQKSFVEIARQQREAEQVIAQSAQARDQLAAVEEGRAEAGRKLEELRAKEAEYAGYRDGHAAAQQLLARIWPAWLVTPEFSRWRVQIEDAIHAVNAPPAATLLFSALHGYNAALREAGDSRVLLDSLRELSRRLFAWLKELGQSEEEAAAVAQAWAAQINRECAGKAEVEVPLPGNPAEAGWMLFAPRTGSADIVSVQTWCVRDAQKRPINKAQVTL